MENFIEKISQLLESESNNLASDTVFKDLDEWDSLFALSLIAMVDEEYSFKLTGEHIRKANTINDLFAIINERK